MNYRIVNGQLRACCDKQYDRGIDKRRNPNTLRNNELMHWKYIKKEKKSNGKWRYYYNNPPEKKYNVIEDILGVDERDAYKKAADDVRYTEGQKRLALENYQNVTNTINNRYWDAARSFGDSQLSETAKENLEQELDEIGTPLYKEFKDKESEYKAAGKKYTEAKDKYYNTPIGVVDKIATGIGNAVENAKRWVNNLFKSWFG